MALKTLHSSRHYNNNFNKNDEFCEYNKFSCTETYSNEAYPKSYKNCFKILKKTEKSNIVNKKIESYEKIATNKILNTYSDIKVLSTPLEINSTNKRFSASFLKTPTKKLSTSLPSSTVLSNASSTLIQNSNNQSVVHALDKFATKRNKFQKEQIHIEELEDLKNDSPSQLITTVTPQTCAIKSISQKYDSGGKCDYSKNKVYENNYINVKTNQIKYDYTQHFLSINLKTAISYSSPSLSSPLTSPLSPRSSFSSHPIAYSRSFSLPHNPPQQPTSKRVSFDLTASKCYYNEKIKKIECNNETKTNNENNEVLDNLTDRPSKTREKNIYFQTNHDVLHDKNEFLNVKTDKANQNNCQDSSYSKINKQGNYHEENSKYGIKFETKTEEKVNNIYDTNKNSGNIGLNNVDDDIVVMSKNLGLTHNSSNNHPQHRMFQNEISQDENRSESYQFAKNLQHNKYLRDSHIPNILKFKQLPLSKNTQHLFSLPPICPNNHPSNNVKKPYSNTINSQHYRHHFKSSSESNINFGEGTSLKETELSINGKNKMDGGNFHEQNNRSDNLLNKNDSSVQKSSPNDYKTSSKVGYSCVKGHRRKASLGTKDFLNEFPNLISDNVQYKLKAGI